MYARLLLYHLPQRVNVLRRLWDAVAAGGHLLIQEYDLRSIGILPTLDSLEELRRVLMEAFTAAGCDVQIGARLPELFAQAGIGAPDGTDVSGHLEPLAEAHRMFTAAYTSVLPTAIAHGITTEQHAAATLSEVARDAERFPDRPTLWPLLIGAWKRKPGGLPRTESVPRSVPVPKTGSGSGLTVRATAPDRVSEQRGQTDG